MAVHFEAKRTGMRGLPRADLPRLRTVLREQGHLFLPLVVIVSVLLAGYSAPFSDLVGTAPVMVAAGLRKSTQNYPAPRNLLDRLDRTRVSQGRRWPEGVKRG